MGLGGLEFLGEIIHLLPKHIPLLLSALSPTFTVPVTSFLLICSYSQNMAISSKPLGPLRNCWGLLANILRVQAMLPLT